jgi:hypothetical protein
MKAAYARKFYQGAQTKAKFVDVSEDVNYNPPCETCGKSLNRVKACNICGLVRNSAGVLRVLPNFKPERTQQLLVQDNLGTPTKMFETDDGRYLEEVPYAEYLEEKKAIEERERRESSSGGMGEDVRDDGKSASGE